MVTIKMMVGLPCAGKSDWIHNDIRTLDYDETFIILSTDDIIQAVALEFGLTYNDVFKELYPFAEMMMYRKLETALDKYARPLTIYWDQTNLTDKSRRRKINKVKELMEKYNVSSFNINCIEVDTPIETCKERQKHRKNKFICDDVINDMASRYVRPTREEGFDGVINIPSFSKAA